MSETNGNGDKLSRLEEKVKAAETRLAAEQFRVAKREKAETKKLEGIIGAAILKELRELRNGTPENHKEAEALETILKGILASQAVAPLLSAADRKLLNAKGWLS